MTELEGDVGKHLKTHNKTIYTAAGSTSTGSTYAGGTSTKKEGKMKYTNTNEQTIL